MFASFSNEYKAGHQLGISFTVISGFVLEILKMTDGLPKAASLLLYMKTLHAEAYIILVIYNGYVKSTAHR